MWEVSVSVPRGSGEEKRDVARRLYLDELDHVVGHVSNVIWSVQLVLRNMRSTNPSVVESQHCCEGACRASVLPPGERNWRWRARAENTTYRVSISPTRGPTASNLPIRSPTTRAQHQWCPVLLCRAKQFVRDRTCSRMRSVEQRVGKGWISLW